MCLSIIRAIYLSIRSRANFIIELNPAFVLYVYFSHCKCIAFHNAQTPPLPVHRRTGPKHFHPTWLFTILSTFLSRYLIFADDTAVPSRDSVLKRILALVVAFLVIRFDSKESWLHQYDEYVPLDSFVYTRTIQQYSYNSTFFFLTLTTGIQSVHIRDAEQQITNRKDPITLSPRRRIPRSVSFSFP